MNFFCRLTNVEDGSDQLESEVTGGQDLNILIIDDDHAGTLMWSAEFVQIYETIVT